MSGKLKGRSARPIVLKVLEDVVTNVQERRVAGVPCQKKMD